jgi:hypothetical protein
MQQIILLRLGRSILASSDLHELDHQDLLGFCSKNNWKDMFGACPSMNMENLISNFRSSDSSRKPKSSDLMDLTLACATFPYVDFFATEDGYLKEGLKYVKSKCPRIRAEFTDF